MAISKSILLAGASGRIGDIIIRQRNGKTVLSMAPDYKNRKFTPLQKKQQERFAELSKSKRKK